MIKNVVFGEVWLYSGQSNIELTMDRLAEKYSEDIAGPINPNIREFQVKRTYSFTAQDSLNGKWKAAEPKAIGQFSAVAYNMAKNLYQNTKYLSVLSTPVGAGHPPKCRQVSKGLKILKSIQRGYII